MRDIGYKSKSYTFCGLSLKDALQAAHIIPWNLASPEQRVSPLIAGTACCCAQPITPSLTPTSSASRSTGRSCVTAARSLLTVGLMQITAPRSFSTDNLSRLPPMRPCILRMPHLHIERHEWRTDQRRP